MSQQRGIYDVFGNPVYDTQPASTNALASAIGYFMGRNMGEHALKRQQNKVDEWLDQHDPNSDYNFMQQVAKPQEYIDALGSSLGVKTAGASQANESQLSPAEQRKQQQEEKMNNIRGFRQEMQAAGLLTRNGNPNYNVSTEGTQLIQEAMERWGLTKDDL